MINREELAKELKNWYTETFYKDITDMMPKNFLDIQIEKIIDRLIEKSKK